MEIPFCPFRSNQSYLVRLSVVTQRMALLTPDGTDPDLKKDWKKGKKVGFCKGNDQVDGFLAARGASTSEKNVTETDTSAMDKKSERININKIQNK